jgi:hypothetical protein
MSAVRRVGIAATVALLLNGACRAETPEEMSAELKTLRNRIDQLQQQLESQGVTPAAPAATPAPATVPPPPGTPAEAAVANGPLHYKGIAITLGGFVAAETIYREHNQANDISTSFNATPYENSPVGHTSETRYTARQSRFSLLAQGAPNPDTLLSFYSEFDLQGGAQTANSNESNSYNPRLRHLYAAVDWDSLGLHVLAGQTWSLVTLNGSGITPRNEVAPPTIEGQYIPGFSWTRQPQVRLTKDFDHRLWLALSLENPQTTFYAGANPFPGSDHLTYQAPAGQGFDSANSLSLNRLPDVIGKIAYELAVADRDIHLETFGLYRDFYTRLDFHNQNVSGEGVGAGITVQVVPHLLDIEASGIAGRGIGRYGSGQLPDVTFDPGGDVEPLREIQALAGITLHATAALDVYAFAGEEKVSAQSYSVLTAGAVVAYGYGNPLYPNLGCMTEGSAATCVGNTRLLEQGTLGFWYKAYAGNFGQLRYGMQYERTEREGFNGVGGEPVGTQNTVLASFRYYPF